MKILFAGTPAIAVEVLEGLLQAGHEVVGILTREQAMVGRKKTLTASPVSERGTELGIPVIEANKISTGVLDIIRGLDADLAVVVAYGVILKAEALDLMPLGWYNLHFSSLPKWRGAAPVQRSIEAGETETGVTLFRLDKGMDSGPIVAIAPALIHPNETADDLLLRLGNVATSLITAELPGIFAGTSELKPQDGQPTFATKPTRQDAHLNFSLKAKHLVNTVRAMNSEPMAWCNVDNDSLRIIEAVEYMGTASEEVVIGEVTKHEQRVLVRCGENTWLELVRVQPSSKNEMSAKDWLNGKPGLVVLS
jgi:methionyl-tRNA formyltransferase